MPFRLGAPPSRGPFIGGPTRIPWRTIADIPWSRWRPRQRATLLFIIRAGRILLIRKKRGLGAGKINGPGGRIRRGESARAAAIREVQEEVGITPLGVRYAGRLRFQFLDGFSIVGEVFRASRYRGTPVETAEAMPRWYPLRRLPYAQMWADDRVWLPLILAGRCVEGRFLFDGDHMLDYDVKEILPPSQRRACRRSRRACGVHTAQPWWASRIRTRRPSKRRRCSAKRRRASG